MRGVGDPKKSKALHDLGLKEELCLADNKFFDCSWKIGLGHRVSFQHHIWSHDNACFTAFSFCSEWLEEKLQLLASFCHTLAKWYGLGIY